MTGWLYQMSVDYWDLEDYRLEVWEGQNVRWRVGQIDPNCKNEIEPGHIVYLFYVKSGNIEPGIYGWGIILNYNEEKGIIHYRPVFPSDYLKMNPIWNDDVSLLMDNIRGKFKQRTMWEIIDDDIQELNNIIHDWINGGN